MNKDKLIKALNEILDEAEVDMHIRNMNTFGFHIGGDGYNGTYEYIPYDSNELADIILEKINEDG